MSFLNTLNTPKLLEEDGVIKFLPVIYAQQYEIEYRYVDELGRIQSSGSLTIDYDSRANDIGDNTYFIYEKSSESLLTFKDFIDNYNDTFSVKYNGSRYYTSGFLILNTSKTSDIKPIDLSYNNNTYKIGIQNVVTYFESDLSIVSANMKFNNKNIPDIFDEYSEIPPTWDYMNYIRYCFNAVNLSTYMNNIQYNSVRIKAKNGRFPNWYTTKNDSSWSNWFYINYKPDKILLETYVNNAEVNTLYKYCYLDFKGIITGIFRNDITVTNPNILIESSTYPNFNYVYIREFDRFYFIDNITINENKLYTLHCSVDVLMSFRHKIDLQEVILSRSQSKYDDLLVDDYIPARLNYKLTEIHGENDYDIEGVPKIFDWRPIIPTTGSRGYENIIISRSIYEPSWHFGYTPIGSSNEVVVMSDGDFNVLVDNFYGNDFGDFVNSIFQNPYDMIISIKKYPFCFIGAYPLLQNSLQTKPRKLENDKQISYFGWRDKTRFGRKDYDIDSFKSKELNDTGKVLINGGRIDVSNIELDYFLSYEPYTLYELYIPFVGFMEISGKKLLNSKYVYIFYVVDISVNSSLCIVFSSDYEIDNVYEKYLLYYGNIIATFDCDLSIDVPITSTNTSDISRGILKTGIAAISKIGALGSVISSSNKRQKLLEMRATKKTTPKTKLGAKIEQEKISRRESISKGVNDIASGSTIDIINSMTLKASSGNMSNSNISNVSIGYIPYLKIYNPDIPSDYKKYTKLLGKPSSFIGNINDLDGYNKIAEMHLNHLDNITTEEIDEIEDILLSGIYVGDRKF